MEYWFAFDCFQQSNKPTRRKIMAGKRNKGLPKVRKQPLPSAKKIATRGLYEVMWGAKKRDYGKYVGL
jgi:hypothetical protein